MIADGVFFKMSMQLKSAEMLVSRYRSASVISFMKVGRCVLGRTGVGTGQQLTEMIDILPDLP